MRRRVECALQEGSVSKKPMIKSVPRDQVALYQIMSELADFKAYDELVKLCDQTIAIYANDSEAYRFKAYAFFKLGKLSEAEMLINLSIQKNKNSEQAYIILALIQQEKNEPLLSIESCKKVLQLNPNHAEIYAMLGFKYLRVDSIEEAETAFKKAIELKHETHEVYTNLGLVSLWKEDNKTALHYLSKARQSVDEGRVFLPENGVMRHKVEHDYQQLQYLIERGYVKASDHVAYLDSLQEILEAYPDKNMPYSIKLNAKMIQSIAPSFCESIHIYCPEEIPGGALNPELNYQAIEEEYFDSKPEMVCIDDFLKPETLVNLRRHCVESSIWKKVYHTGYLGAMLGAGFSNPLLLQIAREIPKKMPRIFSGHRLNQAWSFKCDSHLKGITLHADFAAVNLNLWVTEQDSVLDPSKCGLIVWDKESPDNWTFSDYNSSQNKIREFLRNACAKPIRIPYKENRILMFNSTLFHETDEIKFKDQFDKRRLNITFLYGQRLLVPNY